MRMPLLCTVHEVVNWRVESSIRGAVLLRTLHRVRLITSRDGPRSQSTFLGTNRSSMLPGYFLVPSTQYKREQTGGSERAAVRRRHARWSIRLWEHIFLETGCYISHILRKYTAKPYKNSLDKNKSYAIVLVRSQSLSSTATRHSTTTVKCMS